MPKKHQSKIAGVVHRAMKGAHRAGVVSKITMREFDAACLTPIGDLNPKDIIAIRERAGVSQGVFARHLNVPTTLVSQWERGERRPTGAAVKLLTIVKHKGLDPIAQAFAWGLWWRWDSSKERLSLTSRRC